MHAELHNGHCVSVYTDVNTTALHMIAYIYRDCTYSSSSSSSDSSSGSAAAAASYIA
jgi:hypothetical protein